MKECLIYKYSIQMMRMLELQSTDIHDLFIVMDKTKSDNIMILEYVGIDGFGENSHLTHKFRYSYNSDLHIYHVYYSRNSQECYILQPIALPFDITTIINQYLHP